MSQMQSPGGYTSTAPFSAPGKRPGYLKHGVGDELYVDYRAVEDLRRAMTPNGKIYSRKRLSTTAREQRMLSQAIKRARYMALLPYTDATL
jgi:small subunit ribosomal protein S18